MARTCITISASYSAEHGLGIEADDHSTPPPAQCSAIVFPPECLRVAPDDIPQPMPDCSDRPALQRLPTEVLIAILPHLSVTSRVNLALTSKFFANLLTDTPNTLSFELGNFNLPSIPSSASYLITTDKTFPCYNPHFSDGFPENDRFTPLDSFSLRCDHCSNVLWRHHRINRFKHIRNHECFGDRSRLFTKGMFKLMEWGLRLRVAERNRILLHEKYYHEDVFAIGTATSTSRWFIRGQQANEPNRP